MFCHISIGDFLRDQVAKQCEDASEIHQHMKDGELLPWDILVKYLKLGIDTLVVATGKQWVLLDGFPRTLSQGNKFEQLEVIEMFPWPMH